MMLATVPNSFHRDRYTIYFYIMLAIYGMKQSVLGSIAPFLRDELGLTTAQIGWHFSIYALGLILSGRAVTELNRALPAGRILEIGAALMVTIIILLTLADATWATLTLSLLLGTVGGTVQITIQSSLANYHDRYQSVALVEAFVFGAAGVFVGSLVIGYAAEAGYGWRSGLSVPAILLALTFLFLRSGAKIVAQETTVPVGARLPLSGALVLGMIILGIATEWGIGFWGAQFLEGKLIVDSAQAVTMMSLFFGGTVAGRIVASRLLLVVEVRSLLVALIVLGGLSVGTLALASETVLTSAALFASGACLGNFFPLILSLANEVVPGRPTDVSRGATQAVGFALLTAPVLIGHLGEALGLTTAVGLLAFFPAVMLALLLMASTIRN